MNKKDLIRLTAERCGITRTDTSKVLNVMLDVIIESIEKEEPVRILELGTFTVKKRGARNGYNPATKKEMKIPERKVVRFAPSKRLRNL